jgi:hypothetical protein
MVHSGSGKRGASADKNRLVRSDFTSSQHNPLGTMATACHVLLTGVIGPNAARRRGDMQECSVSNLHNPFILRRFILTRSLDDSGTKGLHLGRVLRRFQL